MTTLSGLGSVEVSVSGIAQSGAFPFWLLSPSVMSSRFILEDEHSGGMCQRVTPFYGRITFLGMHTPQSGNPFILGRELGLLLLCGWCE